MLEKFLFTQELLLRADAAWDMERVSIIHIRLESLLAEMRVRLHSQYGFLTTTDFRLLSLLNVFLSILGHGEQRAWARLPLLSHLRTVRSSLDLETFLR